ncbi:MAG: sugar transferase [Planctomycetales bacterium]
MRHLMDWLIGRTGERTKGSVDYLLPSDRTHAVLERERKRADRLRGSFSLLVISPVERESLDKHLAELAEHLERRLRTTDVAGFLDRHRIGVMLPGASGEEAWKVARALPLVGNDGSRPFRVEVHAYPTHQVPDGDQSGPGRDATPATGGPRAAGSEQSAVRPLEALFVRATPWWKRCVDVCGAVFGLVVLAPLLLLTATLIKLTSPGPVFFRQLRDGLGGGPFTIYKFRTMYVDAEARKAELRKFSEQDGPAFKMTNDPRITPLGRFLRKTCIDELPQFWNVLKGDMSLVGPRPLDCKEAQHIDGWGRRRLEVTPGLTCIWQVHGKSKVSFNEWMRMDIRYMKGRSFFRDLKLVFETVAQVLRSRGSV